MMRLASLRSVYLACGFFLSTAVHAESGPGNPEEAPWKGPAAEFLSHRKDPAVVHEAISGWEKTLRAAPKDFEAAWKLSMAWYFAGSLETAKDARVRSFRKGVEAAELAVSIAPDRVEGYYWGGILRGSYAGERNLLFAATMVGAIRDSFVNAVRISPCFDDGGSERALGRFYFMAPAILGGSNRKSLDHLQRSLACNPGAILTRLYLADTLAGLGKEAAAKKEYQAVLELPAHPFWEAEDRENKALAERALKRL